jgi:hypothetical protein
MLIEILHAKVAFTCRFNIFDATAVELYSLQTSSIHCNVFGDVLIHDTSSVSEEAQALM